MQKITIDNQNAKNLQAYIEYRNIVGNDDGGKLMSEKEFEEYKKNVAQKRKDHLYVYWVNSDGFECKAIGPESMCFCNHRYKAHDFDSVKDKKVKCKDKKCKCKLFDYVPVYGANDVKCLCHHSYREHELGNRKCKRPNCKCVKFGSKFTCNCGMGYDSHRTVIQTREERQKSGKPVDPGWFGEGLIAGSGGLTSFGSMMNDVYEQEFQALQKAPGEKKVLYANGKPQIMQQQNVVNPNNMNNFSPMNNNLNSYDLSRKPCKYFNQSVNDVNQRIGQMKIGINK